MEIVRGVAVPLLDDAVRDRIAAAEARLRALIARGAGLYGVTTGFGPLAGRDVPAEAEAALQTGLIHHLATGVGPLLDWERARAVVLARLLALARGQSGVTAEVVSRLLALLASPFAPALPARGTVGASGDLTPLAHLALVLMGKGNVIDREGCAMPAGPALATLRLEPLRPTARDGLALVNGTAAMTGVAIVNQHRVERLIDWVEALSVAMAEVMGGRLEAWDGALGAARPHPGQEAAHAALGRRAAGSRRMVGGRLSDGPAVAKSSHPGIPAPPQDAYTLRCVPQITGAVRDVAAFHRVTVEREMAAATDNPILPPELPSTAIHGGNFMGLHVGLASDALAAAVLSLAGLVERQVARLTDERLNGGLPPFLCRGSIGIDSGLMGAQVTATALLAEMRTRAVPATAQSISTNGANQDVVSMGTIAARSVATHLEDLGTIAAIMALAVAQGVDIRHAAGEE
ncbi:MAG: aromatic amino acid ammonia-lyase, partial [Pseudomonadota bacterium]